MAAVIRKVVWKPYRSMSRPPSAADPLQLKVRTESIALTLPRCCRGTQSISTAAWQAVCSAGAGMAWGGDNEAGA